VLNHKLTVALTDDQRALFAPMLAPGKQQHGKDIDPAFSDRNDLHQ
jgi:hypothetical protein